MIKGIVSYFVRCYPLEIGDAINLKHLCAEISSIESPTIDLNFYSRLANSVEYIEFCFFFKCNNF